jgi:hypothetical protein
MGSRCIAVTILLSTVCILGLDHSAAAESVNTGGRMGYCANFAKANNCRPMWSKRDWSCVCASGRQGSSSQKRAGSF